MSLSSRPSDAPAVPDAPDMPVTARPPREPAVPPGGIELFERDMTVTVAADVTLAALDRHLAEAGQWLPIDGEANLPVGRLVEQNSTGPLRLGYGAWRDLLLGCQFQNGMDQLITAGGRAVKNVAGYDLTKLMVGQHGILGRVVTITARTYRRPEEAMLAEFAVGDSPADGVGTAASILARLLPTPARPQWAMLLPDRLLCGYQGSGATLDFVANILPPYHPATVQRQSVEDDQRLRQKHWRTRIVTTNTSEGENQSAAGGFRAAVPPAAIRRFIAAARLRRWAADPAFGIIVGEIGLDAWPAVRSAASAVGGTAYFNASDGAILDLPLSPSHRRIIGHLKQAFDPEGRLLPLPENLESGET